MVYCTVRRQHAVAYSRIGRVSIVGTALISTLGPFSEIIFGE